MAEDKDKNKADLDGDGEVTKKEQKKYDKQKEKEKEDNRDNLESDLMRSDYSWAADLIYSNPRLKELFQEAVKEGWTAAQFIAKFKDTGFYQNHTESWLKAEALKQSKPTAYRDAKLNYAAKIRDDAAAYGIQLSEKEAFRLAETYVRRGYQNAPNAYVEWLTKKVKSDPEQGFSGLAGTTEQEIMKTLSRNGFNSDSRNWKAWVDKTVRQITAGNGTLADALDYIRREAGSRYPSYADKMVSEGKDLQDYASGYISLMSEILEIPEDDLGVRDPKILKAMMGDADDKGNNKPMSLWDFEKELRQDSRWKFTKNANDSAQSAANDLLKMFGFMG